MEFLLDTHTLIWFIEGNNRLPTALRELIEDESNVCLVSIGTFWEIAIKVSIGTLRLHVLLEQYYELVIGNGIELKNLIFSPYASAFAVAFLPPRPF